MGPLKQDNITLVLDLNQIGAEEHVGEDRWNAREILRAGDGENLGVHTGLGEIRFE